LASAAVAGGGASGGGGGGAPRGRTPSGREPTAHPPPEDSQHTQTGAGIFCMEDILPMGTICPKGVDHRSHLTHGSLL